MAIVFALCASIVTAAIVAAVIYLITTLKQVERSARAAEQFLLHADETARHAQDAAQKLSAFANEFQGGWGKTLSFVSGLIWTAKDHLYGNSKQRKTEEKETL
ncbi:MAG: hypothetical protein AAB091_03470 [Elusimicrobiota bacterium]